jgi:hypothetical protein
LKRNRFPAGRSDDPVRTVLQDLIENFRFPLDLVLQPHLLGNVLGDFHDPEDLTLGLPNRIRGKPADLGTSGLVPVYVYAPCNAARIRRQAGRTFLSGLVTWFFVPVRHLVAAFFPNILPRNAKRFNERLVGVENLVTLHIHDHDVLPDVVEHHGEKPGIFLQSPTSVKR